MTNEKHRTWTAEGITAASEGIFRILYGTFAATEAEWQTWYDALERKGVCEIPASKTKTSKPQILTALESWFQ